MKILKFGLRFWITVTSVVSFAVGWIMLVHSPKPAQLSLGSTSSVPTLEPLPPLSAFDSGSSNLQNQPLFSVQPRQRFGNNSFFRTGGS